MGFSRKKKPPYSKFPWDTRYKWKRNVKKGKRFGNWRVVEVLPGGKSLCRCSCGIEKEVHNGSLVSGKSRGCGIKKNHVSKDDEE